MRQELEQLTIAHFGEPMLKSLLRCVFQARASAYSHCRNILERAQAENLYGQLVREMLSCSLLDLGLGSGYETENDRKPGQKWYQAEVHNPPFVLTAARVDYPGAMVHDCDYRRELVESNPSLNLWDTVSKTDKSRIAVILTHSRYRDGPRNPQLPGSACLVYPAADLKKYMHVIDLIARYPETVEPYYPKEWDGEARVRYLRQTSIVGMKWA
jgi:hypothetical protein